MSRACVNKIATRDASKQFNVADVVDMLTNASNLKSASSADPTNLQSLGDWFKQTNRAKYQNHIINGNFDIWQRATSFNFATTANTAQANYTADRWLFQCQANNATITQQFTGPGSYEQLGNMTDMFMRVSLTNVSSSSGYAVLNQRIEKPMRFLGKTITVSFMAKASSVGMKVGVEAAQFTGKGGIFIVGSGKSVNLTTSWARYAVSLAIPANTNAYNTDYSSFLEVGLWMDAIGENYPIRAGNIGRQSGTFDFAQIQVEIGDRATPYRPKSPADELFDCHRYFWKGLPCIGFNFSAAGGGCYQSWNVPFPRTMRDVPSTSFYFAGTVLGTDYSQNLVLSSVNYAAATVYGARFIMQSRATDPNIFINFNNASYFMADAELYVV